METSLAIYEALIQANVPTPAARRVAECLEKDMTSNLATKNDFLLLRQDIEHLSQTMATRFAAFEARSDARFEAVDARFDSLEARFESRFQAVDTRFDSLDARFEAIDTQFGAVGSRFEAFESRMALTIQNMETRLVVKLGALMVALFGLAGTLLKLLG